MRTAFFYFLLLLSGELSAQERGASVHLGLPFGLFGDGSSELTPRPGFALGGEFWSVNEKGIAWSAGISWNSLKRKKEAKSETFEYLTVYGLPLVWFLDARKQWYIGAGAFVNYLLHQELQDNGAVMNDTKSFQRIYAGPSGGLGARMGEEGRSKLLFGLRNDLGLIGFGKGSKQKFNTLTIYLGLEL